MLLGKRPRPPIRRTTSMTGITVDVTNLEAPEPSDGQSSLVATVEAEEVPEGTVATHQNVTMNSGYDQRFLAMLSPRNHWRNSTPGSEQYMETAHFLRTCGLCKRRLAPGRDIYMYRGDSAFCSLECREQQMKQDEIKEKYGVAVASKKEDHRASTASKASSKSGAVAA